jgi:hypothetical protein
MARISAPRLSASQSHLDGRAIAAKHPDVTRVYLEVQSLAGDPAA